MKKHMRKLFSILLTLVMLLGLLSGIAMATESEPAADAAAASDVTEGETEQDASQRFTDVDKDAYYYDAVQWAVDSGISAGTSATTFGTDDPCTRAQMVYFLWMSAGKPTPRTAVKFNDVAEDAYYAEAVFWAKEKGITAGTSETTFSPDDTVTRAQAVTFLYRVLKGTPGGVNPFTDVAEDAYYAAAVTWARRNNIAAGTSATEFSPDDDCTRAQIVTFLYKAYNK